MKNFLFLLLVLTSMSLTAQNDCTVKIVFAKSNATPISYTFKTDPQTTGAKYSWSFSDNGVSDSPTPVHAFAKADTYLVTVKVIGTDGKICYGELKTAFEATVVAPVVTYTGKGKVTKVTSATGCGLLITMDNGAVLVPNEMAMAFEFKDGQYVELAYELLKDKPSGCTSGVSAKITKIADITPVTPCTVKIVSSKNNVNPISYTFKTDPQTTGAKYSWSFGDYGASDSPTPVYAFPKSDTYLVTVKVIGTDGKICYGELKTAFESTVVAPVVTYTGKGKVTKVSSTTGCGLLITMDNGSVLVPIEMAVTFEFKDGLYVELAYELLKDKPSGCTSGVSAKITKIADITPVTPCTVKIVSSKNNVNPISYTFKTDPLTTGAKYLWSFSDGGVSDSPTPVHAFAKADTYLVTVKVTGTDGKICTGELKTAFEATSTAATTTTYTARGKVTGLSSVSGCGLVISLDNTTRLIPAKMMTDFILKEGQYVEFTYEKFAEKVTNCKEGQDVKIITIKEILTTLPICKGPINLLLYDPTDNKCNGSATVKLLDENGKELANVKYLWSDGRTGSSAGSLCPDKLYTVQATLENVCQKNTSFTLLSKPAWHTSTLNGSNTFTVLTPSNDVQYVWNFGNGVTMTGATVNYTFPQDGVFDVQLKALSLNGSSELTQQVVVSKSQNQAQAAVVSKTELQLYPNPVKEILRVDFKNSDAKELTIQIKNMSGQIVYLNQITNDGSSHTDLNIQNLKAGIYMLRIYNGQQLIGERKFIKAE